MKIPRLQYVIAALLFLATMINYLTASPASSRGNCKDFKLSDADYGHIVALFWLRTRLCTRVGDAD
jgi:hypothetical protein